MDIADGEAEEFIDASPSGDAEHEKPSVASFKGPGETCGHSSDFGVVKGSCAFHSIFAPCPIKNIR